MLVHCLYCYAALLPRLAVRFSQRFYAPSELGVTVLPRWENWREPSKPQSTDSKVPDSFSLCWMRRTIAQRNSDLNSFSKRKSVAPTYPSASLSLTVNSRRGSWHPWIPCEAMGESRQALFLKETRRVSGGRKNISQDRWRAADVTLSLWIRRNSRQFLTSRPHAQGPRLLPSCGQRLNAFLIHPSDLQESKTTHLEDFDVPPRDGNAVGRSWSKEPSLDQGMSPGPNVRFRTGGIPCPSEPTRIRAPRSCSALIGRSCLAVPPSELPRPQCAGESLGRR